MPSLPGTVSLSLSFFSALLQQGCVCLPSHLNRGRLEGLVAEHLDHLYYIKDIIGLGIESLNSVLTDQLLNRLLVPLYVFSLTDQSPFPEGVSGSRCLYVTGMCSFSCYLKTAGESSYQQYSGSLPLSSGASTCTACTLYANLQLLPPLFLLLCRYS